MAEKVVIGLTGNIAVGKSLVLRMLQELGATTIDADKLAHQLMRRDGPVYQAIVDEFGKFILDEEGQIDRRKLGRIVFSMPDALARLEAITHPAVRQEIVKRIQQADTEVVVVEAIKLFESGLAEQCTVNWVVTAPPDVQLKRLVKTRKMPVDQAQQRIKAQPPQEEKIAKADLVIDNSGDVAKTWLTVKKHYTELVQKKVGAKAPAPTEPVPVARKAPLRPADIKADEIQVRRAKRPDLEGMARVITRGTKGAYKPDASEMMEALFSRAYLVAEFNGYIIGIAGWQTENLIAGLQDFYVIHDDLWPSAGKKMLERIHEEVDKLSCEVALAFVPKMAGSRPVEFFESQGYQQAELKDLSHMWREVAAEWQPEDSTLLYYKLREKPIMVPI